MPPVLVGAAVLVSERLGRRLLRDIVGGGRRVVGGVGGGGVGRGVPVADGLGVGHEKVGPGGCRGDEGEEEGGNLDRERERVVQILTRESRGRNIK